MVESGDDRAERLNRAGLGWLICARLLLAGLSLGLAVILDRLEGGHGNPGIWGVYWTVIAAFVATIGSALMVPRVRDPQHFATVQVCIDVAIVTALVYFSGGGESVFTFLYALVVLYGALALDRRGVFLAAGLAALGFGVVLFGSDFGLLPSVGETERSRSMPVLAAYWAFYAGALLVLGMLANTLSAELRRTGAALDRRTHDLRRLRDLHLRTVESMESGLLTTDDAGRITSFNPEAVRITGVAADDAEGRLLEELIPGTNAFFEWASQSPTEAARGTRDRIPFQNAEGESLFLGLGASDLRSDPGEEGGRVVIFQDVTRVVSMERDLRQSERLAAVGEMAARIAHEIRNPLASISGSVQILQSADASPSQEPDASQADRSADQDEREQLMGIVVREVDRLNDLIGNFLLYSRPTPLKLQPVDLAEMVREVAKMSESQLEKRIEVELDLEDGVLVQADADQLRSVVWNLWNNAVEAIGDQGHLAARVRRIPRDGTQAGLPQDRQGEGAPHSAGGLPSVFGLLEIEDDGGGIDPALQETIFEPFFTTKRTGTGLGLATVQRIIEQHGGSIEVDSTPAVGTRFRVLLPEPSLDGEGTEA